jgi:hypothetical protein
MHAQFPMHAKVAMTVRYASTHLEAAQGVLWDVAGHKVRLHQRGHNPARGRLPKPAQRRRAPTQGRHRGASTPAPAGATHGHGGGGQGPGQGCLGPTPIPRPAARTTAVPSHQLTATVAAVLPAVTTTQELGSQQRRDAIQGPARDAQGGDGHLPDAAASLIPLGKQASNA